MKKRLQVSLRALVAHSLRSGHSNLEPRVAFARPLDAIRAHQKVQGSMRGGSLTSLRMKTSFARTLIEEIKTTARYLEKRARGEES